MILNGNSDYISFDSRVITPEEINNSNIPQGLEYLKKHIIEHNGEYYYAKRSDTYSMINELIGSYLAKKLI